MNWKSSSMSCLSVQKFDNSKQKKMLITFHHPEKFDIVYIEEFAKHFSMRTFSLFSRPRPLNKLSSSFFFTAVWRVWRMKYCKFLMLRSTHHFLFSTSTVCTVCIRNEIEYGKKGRELLKKKSFIRLCCRRVKWREETSFARLSSVSNDPTTTSSTTGNEIKIVNLLASHCYRFFFFHFIYIHALSFLSCKPWYHLFHLHSQNLHNEIVQEWRRRERVVAFTHSLSALLVHTLPVLIKKEWFRI